MKMFFFLTLFIAQLGLAQDFPAEWFKEIPRSESESWEILPQDAKEGEVILSKRTELGIFSNFAATPFSLDNKSYASVEGLWQALKYPDPEVLDDPRHAMEGWSYSRSDVEQMIGTEAKKAGNAANKIYSKYQFRNISYGARFFDYKDFSEGSEIHYLLIKSALRAKLDQTEGLWSLLMKTGCLKLMPDHKISSNDPLSYHHYKIFMELRREKQFVPCPVLQWIK